MSSDSNIIWNDDTLFINISYMIIFSYIWAYLSIFKRMKIDIRKLYLINKHANVKISTG